jgi:beta-lactamase regulating signal transducer with metallopeptidase domain
MTAAWMLYLLLVGVLVALAAGSLASATRAVGRPTRWVWAGALAGIVVLAAVAPRQEVGGLRVAMPVTQSSTQSVRPGPTTVTLLARLRAARQAAGDDATAALSGVAARVPRPVEIAFAAAWLTGSAALLALFVGVNVRLARARRRWPASQTCGTAVRVAPNSGPAVLGLLRAEIVVPRALLDRSSEEQRLILVHEREHVRARDHLLLAGAWLVAIALPWHPAVWALVARLRLAIELDCDARVLRGGVSPKSYGALLIDVASHHGGIRIGALALADGPSHLERRILAMNAPRKRHAVAYGAVLCGLGTLLVLAACEAKIPTSTEIAQMDVAGVEKSAAEGGYMRTPSGDRTDFFINGVKTSAEQARAMEAKNIGSIEFVRSELPSGRDTILVTTADRMPPRPAEPDSLEAAQLRGSGYFYERIATPDSSEHLVEHVERERALERAVAAKRAQIDDANLMSQSPTPAGRERMKVRTGEQPVIMIDGRRASEAQLAALDEKDIGSMAIYKGASKGKPAPLNRSDIAPMAKREGEARMNLRSDAKGGLEVASDPTSTRTDSIVGSVISVTTKAARAKAAATHP